MNFKSIILFVVMLNNISCFGQSADNFDENKKLKQELIKKHITSVQGNKKETDALITGKFSNDRLGGGFLSNIIFYNNSIYKFEFVGEINGYYDIGKFSYKNDVIELTSLINKFSDKSDSLYHNKIVDMTGAQFSYDKFSIHKEIYYRLTSFGKTTNSLIIENDGKREWIQTH